MTVRSKRRSSIIHPRRERPARKAPEHPDARTDNQRGDGQEAARAEPRRAHRGGTPQDRAVYACQCGMVFEEHVSTSVGCPHCGCTQAW